MLTVSLARMVAVRLFSKVTEMYTDLVDRVSSLTQALALSFTTTMSIPRLAMQIARSSLDGIRLISLADGQLYEQTISFVWPIASIA